VPPMGTDKDQGRPSGPAGYVWHQVAADAPFAPRDGAGALVHDGRMWLLGGWYPRD
jgi:hypothetical protein